MEGSGREGWQHESATAIWRGRGVFRVVGERWREAEVCGASSRAAYIPRALGFFFGVP
jgi:hypothetical protein